MQVESKKNVKKTKFKMPTAFTTLLILTCVIAIFTHIIPSGEYQYQNGIPIKGTYEQVAANPQGIWDIMAAPIKGFHTALDVALFVLVLGGCLGIIFETEAIDAGLAKIAVTLKGREKLMIPVLMGICSIGGASYGMAEETIAFYPLVVPILLAAGYDVVTGIMTIFLGAGIGILGGIVNPFSTGVASNLAGISLAEGMVYRLALLVSALTFAVIFVMRYAEKVKKDPTKSIVYDMKDEVESTFKRENSGKVLELTKERRNVLIVFGITFAIMIIGIIPWDSKFGIDIFVNLHNTIKAIPILGGLIGNTVALGDWGFQEMTVLFFISSIVIAKVYKIKEEEIVRIFIAGTKDLLSVALILGVAKGISIVMNDGLIIGTILNFGEKILSNLSSGVFIVATYLMYIPMSFLIPSSSGLATATVPILAPLADFAGVGREFIVLAFQAGAETMNLFSPTQVVLIGALTLAKIPYTRWVKHIIPFVIGIMMITMAILTLGVMVS